MNSTTETGNSSPSSVALIQPIPAAIPVGITGSQVNEGTRQRELFTEQTETVLLLPNGAVIRLAATANAGQLLFLTNKDTGREVVTRVVKYKKSASGSGYAELDFTEPVEGFWGSHFRLEAAKPRFPTSAAGFKAASGTATPASAANSVDGTELAPTGAEALAPQQAFGAPPVKSSILTIEEAGKQLLEQPAPAAPTAAELNDEISFLQQQLNSLLAASAPTGAASAGTPPPDSSAVAGALLKMLDTARGTTPGPAEIASPKVETPSQPAPGAPSVANTLFSGPGAMSGTRQTTADAEVPKASGATNSPLAYGEDAFPPAHYHPPPPSRGIELNKGLLAGVLVFGILMAGGVYWYFHRARAAAAAEMSAAARSSAAVGKKAVTAASTKKVEKAGGLAGSGERAIDDKKEEDVQAGETVQPKEKIATVPPSAASEKELHSEAENELKDVSERPRAHQVAGESSREAASPPPVEPTSGPLEPAKVLKAVRAVAPPEATREYVSGNVMIDAVVDATGRVTSMKIVSGPEILRKAAMDALRQYQYQPATRNGKSVSSHVTAKIQFWYEP